MSQQFSYLAMHLAPLHNTEFWLEFCHGWPLVIFITSCKLGKMPIRVAALAFDLCILYYRSPCTLYIVPSPVKIQEKRVIAEAEFLDLGQKSSEFGHRHYSIQYLSPVPEHSGMGLGPLIPVQDWLWHSHYCSFRYRTDQMADSPAFKKHFIKVKRDLHPTRPHCKRWSGIHPQPLCWWKGIHPACPIVHTILEVERDTP
jgi:hypothetical protein